MPLVLPEALSVPELYGWVAGGGRPTESLGRSLSCPKLVLVMTSLDLQHGFSHIPPSPAQAVVTNHRLLWSSYQRFLDQSQVVADL